MAKGLQEFIDLKEQLLWEKEADLEQYKQKIERLPLDKRKEEGVAWYPLNVLQRGYTIGERAFVVVERTTMLNEKHQFRSGKTVRLFSNQPAVNRGEANGVVYFVHKNRMKIILNSKDLPDWVGLGMVGVDLLFDERTYQVMEKTLDIVMEAGNGRLQELRDIFQGKQDAQFNPVKSPVALSSLNVSQNEAVQAILSARDVSIVHGPPGTGKTTTIVQAVRLLCETEHTVLVTAPSNTAVDLLTERLSQQGLNVVRIGNISRVDEDILSHTLDVRMSEHPDSKNIKKVKIEAAEARRQARKYRRKFGRDEYLERKNLYREAKELMAWANQLEDRLIDQILDGAQVITCTLIGAADKVLTRRKFRTVVIDEAAQALEPATWVPILKASKVVLTGDPYQLPPTVKSRKAANAGFAVTLIEKSLDRLHGVQLLRTQYRMNREIMGFSNQEFYDGLLEAAPSVAEQRLTIQDNTPVIFIDTAGCGFDEKINPAYRSRYNPEEAQILFEHLYELVDHHLGLELPSIALISPYREQVLHLEDRVEDDAKLAEVPLTINTIDGFQGQERDVVYISLVRSNAKGEIGFLSDYRRMNVAMTRARKQLVVIGDSATIGNTRFYQDFLAYAEDKGEYRTAWQYMM
ncbi:MAG TPA: AAA domain-containing protein [Saprospiraceae bacterium]|nr:AAA domain-containing protein [Saprospiraceae bacterium]